MRASLRPVIFITLFLVVFGSFSAGCSSSESRAGEQHPYGMAHLADLPAEVQAAPVVVQQAYQFAVANPEVLNQIPCYCGCGGMGHDSNYACYVADTRGDGQITYDSHALGCSICVDITQDTMRLLDQGKGVAEIKAYVDGRYARFGPSNIP